MLQDLLPLSSLVIFLDPSWQPPSSYAELCQSLKNFLEIPGAHTLVSSYLLCIWNAWVDPFIHTPWAPSCNGCSAAAKPSPSGLERHRLVAWRSTAAITMSGDGTGTITGCYYHGVAPRQCHNGCRCRRCLLATSQAPPCGGSFKCDQRMKLFKFSPKSTDST